MLDSNTTLPKTYAELLIACWHISEHKQEAFFFMHATHSRTFSIIWGLVYSSPRLIFEKKKEFWDQWEKGRLDCLSDGTRLTALSQVTGQRNCRQERKNGAPLMCALSMTLHTSALVSLSFSLCLPPQCLFMIHLSLIEDLFNIKAYQRTFYWHNAFPQLMFGCFGSLNVTKCTYRDILSWLSVCVCVRMVRDRHMEKCLQFEN